MKLSMRWIFAGLLPLLLAGCGLTPAAIQPPTATLAPVVTVVEVLITATQVPPTAVPTATPAPTATPNLTATARAVEQVTATEQARLEAEATQKAEDEMWAMLKKDGAITYSPGTYRDLGDFTESWAQRNWYQWWSFGYKMSDFVFKTHVEWESAQDSSLARGGCGIAFRINKDGSNHLLVFLDNQGGAELGNVSASNYQQPAPAWVDPVLKKTSGTKGGADFIVVAEKEMITVYIDGFKAYKWIVARVDAGDIGFTILSGTNKDFGTTCDMSGNQLWALKK